MSSVITASDLFSHAPSVLGSHWSSLWHFQNERVDCWPDSVLLTIRDNGSLTMYHIWRAIHQTAQRHRVLVLIQDSTPTVKADFYLQHGAHAVNGNAHLEQSVASVPELQSEVSEQLPYRPSSHSPLFAVLHELLPRPAIQEYPEPSPEPEPEPEPTVAQGPADTIYPAFHKQLASASLPTGELLPDGHDKQSVPEVAPVVARYVPAEQLTQEAFPV
jgi:hypothetical protein